MNTLKINVTVGGTRNYNYNHKFLSFFFQKASKDSTTSRLTDTTKYTGSHKERFSEDGKGKGIEGRKDLPDKSGYVTGYKEKDTYDKKH